MTHQLTHTPECALAREEPFQVMVRFWAALTQATNLIVPHATHSKPMQPTQSIPLVLLTRACEQSVRTSEMGGTSWH